MEKNTTLKLIADLVGTEKIWSFTSNYTSVKIEKVTFGSVTLFP